MAPSTQAKGTSSKLPQLPRPAALVLQGSLWLAVALFYTYHFVVMARNAVDVPYKDEWDCFPQEPILPWLWKPHNEHIIFTTKLVIAALWKLNGWNFVTQQYLNFVLFAGLLAGLGVFLKKQVPSLPGSLVALAALWMLSPQLYQNHSWGFQSQWHFMALFLLGTVHFLFKTREGFQSGRDLARGVALAALCAYSLSTGVLAVLAISVVFSVFKFVRSREGVAKREISQWAGTTGSLLAIVAGYAVIIHSQQGTPRYTSPLDPELWRFYLGLIGSGLPLTLSLRLIVLIGSGLLAFYLAPWILKAVMRLRTDADEDNFWALAAVSLALGAVFLSIALGRARLGLATSQSSRYTEFTMMMVPIAVTTWWAALKAWPVHRVGVLSFFAVVCLLSFKFGLAYFKSYPVIHNGHVVGLADLRQAYLAGTEARSGLLYPEPIPLSRLEEAKKLKLSFMEKLVQGR